MDDPLETQPEISNPPGENPTPEELAERRLPPPMHESERENLHATIELLRCENEQLREENDALKAGIEDRPNPQPSPGASNAAGFSFNW